MPHTYSGTAPEKRITELNCTTCKSPLQTRFGDYSAPGIVMPVPFVWYFYCASCNANLISRSGSRYIKEYNESPSEEKALDWLYELIEGMLLRNQYTDLNDLLSLLDVPSQSTMNLVSILTVLLPAKSHLPIYPVLLAASINRAKDNGDWTPKLFHGL